MAGILAGKQRAFKGRIIALFAGVIFGHSPLVAASAYFIGIAPVILSGIMLRYLLVIYELGRIQPDVGTQDIAKTLNCSKATVTKMMGILMDMKLLVRERYGKIYLTDTGFLLAKDLLMCIELIRERFPAMGLDLTEEETCK